MDLSPHALDALAERNIPADWVRDTVQAPDMKDRGADGRDHYFRYITEAGGKCLHVVVDPTVSPPVVVTVFFDRRRGRRP